MRKWLKDLRIKANLSQDELSKKMNISQNYYSSIELGERKKVLDLSLASKIAEIFNVSIEWIAEQERQPSPSAAQTPLPE